MFSSIHSQKWWKWFWQPKKYIVNIEIKISKEYLFIDEEVEAHTKRDAHYKAKQQAFDKITIVSKGLKSLGRVKKISEI